MNEQKLKKFIIFLKIKYGIIGSILFVISLSGIVALKYIIFKIEIIPDYIFIINSLLRIIWFVMSLLSLNILLFSFRKLYYLEIMKYIMKHNDENIKRQVS